MSKIEIHLNHTGCYLPDHLIGEWVDKLVEDIKANRVQKVEISQDLILLAIRVKVKKKEIDHKDIILYSDGVKILIDENGKLSKYTRLMDTFESYLMELIF